MVSAGRGAAVQTVSSVTAADTSAAAADSPPPVDPTLYQLCLSKNPLPFTPGGDTNPGAFVHTYVAGYANDAKEVASAPLGSPTPAYVTGFDENTGGTRPGPVAGETDHYQCGVGAVNLDDQGQRALPPVTATFDAFGTVPVTATLRVVQDGPDPITVVLYQDEGDSGGGQRPNPQRPWTAVVTGRLALQVTAAKVNGVPMDVGSSCRTDGDLSTPGNPVAPGEVMMTGGSNLGDPVPLFSLFTQGGASQGTVTVPPFAGCITPSGENLDGLLTAAASGPGNYEEIVEGAPCVNVACRPGELPYGPPPLFTATHGGQFRSSATVSIASSGFGTPTITCNSQVQGDFPDFSGPLRGTMATLNWTFSNCTGSDNTTWQVTSDRPALFGAVLQCDAENPQDETVSCPVDGAQVGYLGNISLFFTETGPGASAACTGVHMTGFDNGYYASPDELVMPPWGPATDPHIEPNQWFLLVDSSTCPDLPQSTGGDLWGLIATWKLEGANPVMKSVLP